MYKLIDTHSHLFAEEFDADRTEVMNRACEAGITHIVMPNIDMASIEPMLQVCAEYPDLTANAICWTSTIDSTERRCSEQATGSETRGRSEPDGTSIRNRS